MKFKPLYSVLIFFKIALFVNSSLGQNEGDVMSLVMDEDNYPFEIHHVETIDGYILELHRIPGKRESDGSEPGKYPVYLKHGLAECSVLFFLTGPTRALAYILADMGYDVWLGNNRGNYFSKKHKNLTEYSQGFWNFSWHEIGLYDDSAMIDYVLEKTGHKKLFYICHSQGCTELYVLASLKPEYNYKIRLAINLAPAVYLGKLTGLTSVIADFVYNNSAYFNSLGHINLLQIILGSPLLMRMTRSLCGKGKFTQPLCFFFLFTISGFSPAEADADTLSKFFTYFPSGISSKQIIHYAMCVKSPGKFMQYDYGSSTNIKVYNSTTPPEYPLDQVSLPVAIYYGTNDYLTMQPDIELLIQKLSNVVDRKLIDGFAHFDFLMGIDVRKDVYIAILEIFEVYKRKPVKLKKKAIAKPLPKIPNEKPIPSHL